MERGQPRPRPVGDPEVHPTHRLENVKAGDTSVQLLVSTHDDLYDVKNIAAGANSWQVIGAWHDESVQELGKMISTRQAVLNGGTAFGSNHGAGRTLGNGNPRIGRPQGTT
ncbi:hypothetical protein QQZ08_002731 [Neonectria magnoliae]|uniref:Uncharacterized protein n=1 Tax=Neonectria magnoliae TaxID=2732573 RepID=A0ABR1ICM4_9HYPO